MTPRRKAWLLVAVLGVVGVGLGLTYSGEVWNMIAYKKRETDSPLQLRITYLTKRAEWLPGPDLWIPEQSCSPCREAQHDNCYIQDGTVEYWVYDSKNGLHPLQIWTTKPRDLIDVRCACTHPSHQGDQ